MRITPALATITTAAATALGVAGAPIASADAEVQYLGQEGELVNGAVVQVWTVSGLKPSSDTIPYPVEGTLWEATATDEAISGAVTPIVSNLNARAASGQTYRVLFEVATPQGVNPATLVEGEATSGKIYFDVTGDSPDSVVYNAGGPDLLLWVQAPPPPPPATGSTGGYTAPAPTATDTEAEGAEAATEAEAEASESSEAEAAEAATPDAPEGSSGTPLPEGNTGAPVAEGSSGTPLPEGSSGTPLPEDAGTAPQPAAVAPAAPEGSSGTPLPAGEDATAPATDAAPTTTVVPAPPA